MAARKKYSPELVKTICDAIADSGKDIDGIEAGEINKNTFYKWINDKSDFRDAVYTARKAFQDTSLPQLRRYAKNGLKNTLQAVSEGREIITVTTMVGTTPEGDAIDMETVTRKPAMVSVDRAFAYVMGKEIDLIAWLRQGIDLGVFPRQFVEDMIDDIDAVTERIRATVEGRIAGGNGGKTRNPGIDPGTAIAAALGLADIVPVPETVDARQKPTKNLGKVAKNRR